MARPYNTWRHAHGSRDIGKIANTHIDRIKAILENKKNEVEIKAFNAFALELRDDLNDAISDQDVIEMLAQHLVTKPVFDALFENYSFAKENPVSQALDKVLKTLEKHSLNKEADTLEKFYASVALRARGIDSAAGKQKIILELYDKFFRGAFPRLTERLGIVYTPVEVVDFILHSVNDLLQSEFGQSLGSKNVHIIDPFVGTGTFITRLIQSGLIHPADLPHKYREEIHANEIVLLAYYIAAINIEAAYHEAISLARGLNPGLMKNEYTPFPGICLTDTFQLYEKDDEIAKLLANNSDRRTRQKNLDIRVIIGNPPYSAGQTSANDNNQNVKYASLDQRIAETYAAHSTATLQNSLYDSYIRALRWASDRLGDAGILGFVTNAGWIDGNAMDGLRKTLAEEFSSIYVFHLRGNQRTSGETSRQEGGKIFGSGSRAPIAISLLVKNPRAQARGFISQGMNSLANEHNGIFLHDIGDYLSREEKLAIVRDFKSTTGITAANGWQRITPDKHFDWLNQRDDSFGEFISMGDKRDKETSVIFENYSGGLKSNRDAWVYNFSQKGLETTMKETIAFYNAEIRRYEKSKTKTAIEKFLGNDPTKISWTVNLRADVTRNREAEYKRQALRRALYRPFTRELLYFDKQWIERPLQIPRIFPTAAAENLVICVTGRGSTKDFSVMMTNLIPDLEMISKGQCFPLYLYDARFDCAQRANGDRDGDDMFAELSGKNKKVVERRLPSAVEARRDAITDEGLAHFQEAYRDGSPLRGSGGAVSITKEDLFYYIYGLLHSKDYRAKYADNLSKELPRIPRVKSAADFWAFSKAGRALGELHVNYEKQKKFGLKHVTQTTLKDAHYRVEKMRYRSRDDKIAIIYNDYLTLEGIPSEAHDYVVNGKSALDWVVERYCVKTDKDSGIVNDANLWGDETAKNPRYIVDLIERVVTVSLETVKIVNGLPKLEIVEGSAV